MRDCPFDTLKLSRLGDNVATGTPYFEARSIACEMCDDIPCVKACPTGALDRELTDIRKARMGLAVLIDQETCLNFLGLRCDVCYRVCPAIDEAITLELVHNPRSDRHAMLLPTVHSDACTGCGKCEKSCVLPEAAIKVLPFKLAQGKSAEHYRKGWEEKEAAGGSLIGEQEQLPMRGLEGRAYGDTRVTRDRRPRTRHRKHRAATSTRGGSHEHPRTRLIHSRRRTHRRRSPPRRRSCRGQGLAQGPQVAAAAQIQSARSCCCS